MIEKVTLEMVAPMQFATTDRSTCEEMNPKALLLYAAAKCAGLTMMHILQKGHIHPNRLEITCTGELSTATLQPESTFRSFHVIYNIACKAVEEQRKVSRAVELTHDKHCGMIEMLRHIAPVTREVAIVSTESAEKVKA